MGSSSLLISNSTVFIPSEGVSFLTVFIAWLNLDLGIHTCLFPGLDMYTKVWLQFVFPKYVWVHADWSNYCCQPSLSDS